MIFNVWIPPQGRQFDPMMNFYLYSVLLITHVNMSVYMNVFQTIKFLTPSTPSQLGQNKTPVRYVLCLLSMRTLTKFGIKSLN